MSKRFVMGGDTHIIDTKNNEEYYAPCETELLDLLNDQQATIIELKDDKNHLYKAIIKLRQEVAELKTRNAVLSSELNQIPERIKREWLDE